MEETQKNLKIILIVLVILVVAAAAILLFFKLGHNNKIVSIVTLDINPSIEINLNKNEEIVSTKALNSDAEEIISKDLNGKSLTDALQKITEKVIEKGYVQDGKVAILVTSKGEANNNDIKDKLEHSFNSKQVSSEVIVIEQITEADERFARQHNISAAKAAYIIELTRENQNVTMESLVSKSISEIKEMKDTGYYCNEGYTLNGDTCIKKIGEERAVDASVCPDGSVEVDNKCYKTVAAKEEQYCKSGLQLKNGKCVGTEKVDAKAKCLVGTYNSNTGKCETTELAGEGTKKCERSEDKLLDNGRCASPHMGAHFDDPEGTIDPATECCCGDSWVADSSVPNRGWCYNMNGDRDAVVSCPSGQTIKDGKCYKVTTSEATYSCDSGKLEGNKCIVETSRKADTKLVCDSNSVLYQDRVCIDKSSIVEKTKGYKCETTPSKLEGTTCILYEVVDAKH